jgi:propanediol dehydratase small subunit
MDQKFAASKAMAAAGKVRSAAVAIPSAVDDLRGIVSRAVSTARASGRDYIAQNHVAAAAVAQVRPDLTPIEVFDAVRRVREHSSV